MMKSTNVNNNHKQMTTTTYRISCFTKNLGVYDSALIMAIKSGSKVKNKDFFKFVSSIL